jgi:hypothetical protein
MHRSDFPALSVAHFLKDACGQGLPAQDAAWLKAQGFFLDTCLRQIVIAPHTVSPPTWARGGIEWFYGNDAYSFLLQTACGLNSAIPGESNILGQIKSAWTDWTQTELRPDAIRLEPLMQSLFSNCAVIRQQHLQGIGGSSYGSLLRKFLNPTTNGRILIVGAGKLAQSLLPFLSNYDVSIWNRTKPTHDLPANIKLFTPAAASNAAAWADYIIITTPADATNDKRWHTLINTRSQKTVHLGCRRANRGIWTSLGETTSEAKQFADLDDLFDLRRQQSVTRSLRVNHARRACQLSAIDLTFGSQHEQPPDLIAQRA